LSKIYLITQTFSCLYVFLESSFPLLSRRFILFSVLVIKLINIIKYQRKNYVFNTFSRVACKKNPILFEMQVQWSLHNCFTRNKWQFLVFSTMLAYKASTLYSIMDICPQWRKHNNQFKIDKINICVAFTFSFICYVSATK
jgi:hypothetical protein